MKKTLCAFTGFLLMAAIVSLNTFAAASPNPTPTVYLLPTLQIYIPTGDEIIYEYTVPGIGELVDETEHFQFRSENRYIPVDLNTFKIEAETIMADMLTQIPASLDTPISVMFRPPSDAECPRRGEAGSFSITIYASIDTSDIQLRGVLAHEIAHVLNEASTGIGEGAFKEGYATWASRTYWAAWMGYDSLDAAVRSYREADTYIPLYTHLYDFSLAYEGENCLFYRDILYTEWASFVGFLIDEYGIDAFHEVMKARPLHDIRTQPAPLHLENPLQSIGYSDPPDFEGVYGMSLNQLEATWLRQITGES